MKVMKKTTSAFTIVELLIVIVVIAILATISVVAYNGIQSRAYNSQRKNDIAAMIKALELYYVDNGRYPAPTGSPDAYMCLSSPGWNCWGAGTGNSLVSTQYISKIPQDPQFVDNDGCSLPNPYLSRMYAYSTNSAGSGYRIGAYLPGLSSSDSNYWNGGTSLGCMNFVNYLIRKNI